MDQHTEPASKLSVAQALEERLAETQARVAAEPEQRAQDAPPSSANEAAARERASDIAREVRASLHTFRRHAAPPPAEDERIAQSAVGPWSAAADFVNWLTSRVQAHDKPSVLTSFATTRPV